MPEEDPTPPAPAPAPPEGKTFTQADVDRIVKDRVAKEQAKFSGYDELKAKAAQFDALEASSKTDLEKLTEQIEGLKRSQAESETKALRAQIAMAKGLTAAQAKRLAGATQEELEADADEILEAFPVAPAAPSGPPSRQPKPDLSGGGDPTQEPTDVKALIDSIPPTA